MRCTICLSDKHVASSCPMRPRWHDTAICLAFAGVIVYGWIAQIFGR